MSYIRAGWPLRFVEGESNDYVFLHSGTYIEDYGKLTNEGLVEMFAQWFETKKDAESEEPLFKEYMLKQLAEKLNVKLRPKKLTDDEYWELTNEKSKHLDKVFKL